MAEDHDIAKVMRAERTRGTRKPVHLPSEDERQELMVIVKELVRPETSREDFDRTMLGLGIHAGTERFEIALKAWRAGQREKKQQL